MTQEELGTWMLVAVAVAAVGTFWAAFQARRSADAAIDGIKAQLFTNILTEYSGDRMFDSIKIILEETEYNIRKYLMQAVLFEDNFLSPDEHREYYNRYLNLEKQY